MIGGGVSGLTTAYAARRGGASVVCAEAAPRFGGAVATRSRDGYLWEDGANTTFSTRERPHVVIENGLITHLLSGVQTGPANCLDCSEVGRNRDDDYAYTFVQPIHTSPW